MYKQLPPMRTDNLHAACIPPASHMPAAARLHKRKSDVSVSPISPHPLLVHRPSSKRNKCLEEKSSTTAPISNLATQYSEILGRQDAAPPRAQPLLNVSALSWNSQANPQPSMEFAVHNMLPEPEFCHGSACPCRICATPDPSHQMAELPWYVMNEMYPSFPSLKSPKLPFRNGMKNVPPEIIHRVCEYLGERDLGNFRRTTKRHAVIGDDHMFPHGTLHFHLHPDHFDRLQTIAKSPIICKRITTLRLVGSQHGFFRLLSPTVYCLDLGEDQRLYSRLQLQDCIQNLTNLTAIEIRIDVMQYPLLTPDTYHRLSEQMHFMLSDIQSVPSMNIEYLKMRCIGWQSPCCVGARLSRGWSNITVLEDAADRLVRLDLMVLPHPQDLEMNQCQSLAHYLRFATNLEELKLRCGMRGLPRLVDLGEVCRLRWSHLRTVDLECGKIHQRDLLSFFEAHGDLKEVRLGSIVLREGRWTTVIERMSHMLPRLEKIQLSGILHDTRLLETRTFLCGDRLTRWAHQAVVQKQRGPPVVYPPDPLAVAQALRLRDRGFQAQRRAAGLSCDLCKSCGQLKHY